MNVNQAGFYCCCHLLHSFVDTPGHFNALFRHRSTRHHRLSKMQWRQREAVSMETGCGRGSWWQRNADIDFVHGGISIHKRLDGFPQLYIIHTNIWTVVKQQRGDALPWSSHHLARDGELLPKPPMNSLICRPRQCGVNHTQSTSLSLYVTPEVHICFIISSSVT